MLTWRALAATVALSVSSLNVSTCRSPGEGGKDPAPAESAKAVVALPGIDTGALTSRERGDWSTFVSEFLAPCPDQPVSIAQCVKESRDCKACLPAARFLVKQVQAGKTRSQVETAFGTRFAPDKVKDVQVGQSPWKGAADAPVVIVEWADFECPFCGRAAPILDDKTRQFPGAVKLVFKNYPLASHKNSEKAARAAMAAHQQGKFWEMHKQLFAQQPTGLDEPALRRIAQSIGLDMKRFADDLNSETVADAVAADRKQANSLSLEGTPTIYINGRHFDLAQFDINEDLDDWIRLDLDLRGTAPKPAAPTPSATTPEKAGAGPARSAKPSAEAPAASTSPASATDQGRAGSGR